MKLDSFLSRQDSQFVAGIAIFMMLVHHLFGFDSFRLLGNEYVETFSIGGISIERMLAAFGKLCVAVFAFISGYVIWKMRSRYSTWRQRAQRIFRFLIAYWVIVALFMIGALLTGDTIPDGNSFFLGLFGLSNGPNEVYVNVPFAWYVAFYILLIICTPVLLYIYSSNHVWFDVLWFILLAYGCSLISVEPLSSIVSPISAAMAGIIVAKWRLFDTLNNNHIFQKTWVSLGLLAILAVGRQMLILVNGGVGFLDGWLAAIFIFLVVSFFHSSRSKYLSKFFLLMGAYSMNLWFLHGIFFTGQRPLQWIIYWPKISVLIVFVCILILLPVAIACDRVQGSINKILKL